LSYVEFADPDRDVRAAVEKGDYRFVAINGLGQTVPFIDENCPQLRNQIQTKEITGTSDSSQNYWEEKVNAIAAVYAERYNFQLYETLQDLHKLPTTQQVDDPYAGYFFVLPPERRATFTSMVNNLPFGADVKDVIKQLGTPNDDAAGDSAWVFPQEHHSRCLTYVIARKREGLVTETQDQYVDLYFDWKGRFEEVSSQYPPVQSRATPDANIRRRLPERNAVD
jgi:hypothetical protein